MGRELEDVRSWLGCAFSIRQLSFGFGARRDRELAWGGAPGPVGAPLQENERTGLKTRPYKHGPSPIMMWLQNVRKTHQLESEAETAERSAGGAPRRWETVDRFDGFESHGMRI